MEITINGYRPASWNTFYSGRHWSKRKAIADEIHLITIAAIREQHPEAECFRVLVDIEVVVYFKNRPQDPDNVIAKIFIDGLRHAGVLSDDTPRQVSSVTTRSRVDKSDPRVVIRITKADQLHYSES